MELKIDRVTKQYGTKIAVDRLSAVFHYGVYGLLGANGAGKTTLMRMICDIQTPTSGEVLLNGVNIKGIGEDYRDLLGYLPQDFGYYPEFTAFKFMMYIAALKGFNKNAAREKSLKLLESVGLSEVKNKKIRTFSGGMKQRLGIAQAMLNDPKILILDEPTAGLDPKERVRFRNLISSLSKDRMVLLSTHIVSDVEYIAKEILIMKEGKMIHKGAPEKIVKEVQGKVWECSVPAGKAEELTERYNVGNIRNLENGMTMLRVIQEEKPQGDAKEAEPTMEDLYLYYFREE